MGGNGKCLDGEFFPCPCTQYIPIPLISKVRELCVCGHHKNWHQ